LIVAFVSKTMEEKIVEILELKFKEEGFDDLFLVDIHFNDANNKLEIFIDSDHQLPISMCAKINRYLQTHIDEAGWLGEKYVLDVSSPGVGKPLKLKRQYYKNIGRDIELKLKNGDKREGKLLSVEDETLTIEEAIQVEGKKKKELITNQIALAEITKAVIQISFKK
jgi:ribosome maturation factor RimP